MLTELATAPDAQLADLVILASMQLALGRVDASVATIGTAVQRWPSDPAAYLRLGSHLSLLRRYNEAETVLAKGLAIAPNSPALLNEAALAAARGGDLPHAIGFAQRLVAIDRDNVGARFLLASLNESAGNMAAAQQGYEDIIKRHPDHVGALNNLAMLLARAEAPAAALPYAAKAASLAPNNPAVLDTLGWVLLQSGRPADAEIRFRDAIARSPQDADTRFHLALALEAKGDRSAARTVVAEALALAPQFRARAQAEELARRLQSP